LQLQVFFALKNLFGISRGRRLLAPHVDQIGQPAHPAYLAGLVQLDLALREDNYFYTIFLLIILYKLFFINFLNNLN
jgi:hypothetical protein